MWRLFVVFCLTSILLLVSCGSPVAPNNPPNVPNNPPNVPSNPNPANNKTDVSITTTLSWTCSDPDGDSLTYDVYFGTSPTPPLVKSNHTSTTYNPGTLNYGTKYYWKIVAKDSKGGITEGPVWNFTTMSLPSGSLSVQRSFQVSRNSASGDQWSDLLFPYDGSKRKSLSWDARRTCEDGLQRRLDRMDSNRFSGLVIPRGRLDGEQGLLRRYNR